MQLDTDRQTNLRLSLWSTSEKEEADLKARNPQRIEEQVKFWEETGAGKSVRFEIMSNEPLLKNIKEWGFSL